MKKRKKEFRGFYQEIVDDFLNDIENIFEFATKKSKKSCKISENFSDKYSCFIFYYLNLPIVFFQ